MLEFKPLGENVNLIKNYIDKSEISFCDISLGVKYMWRDDFKADYAFTGESLVLKESSPLYQNAFYYPMGGDEAAALIAIEKYCKATGTPLEFCCLDVPHADALQKRYPLCKRFFDRDWSDYIYEAESFKTYSGKKLSGQRNHVNKFKKLYPDYKTGILTENDLDRVKDFLTEFERGTDFSAWSEREEERKVYDLTENSFNIGQVGAYVEVGGKIIAFSVGEVVGDTLIVHVEKALKNYEGAYPFMAQTFANYFAVGGVKYINREEDCGDEGLRTSKTQYHPVEIKEKISLKVFTPFDKIISPVRISTPRAVVCEITEEDGKSYCDLCTDEETCRYWGYDYKSDLNGNAPNEEYFLNFVKTLKASKEEYPLAINLGGALIGEVTLYNFDFSGGCEIGFRLKKEYRGKGYAKECAAAVIDYAFNSLGAACVRTRCYKQNAPSYGLIKSLGFYFEREDEEKFYFIKMNKI